MAIGHPHLHDHDPRHAFYSLVRSHLPASVKATDAEVAAVLADLVTDVGAVRAEARDLLAEVVARRLMRARRSQG